MLTLTHWDHLIVLLVFVVYPAYGKWSYAAVVRDLRERGEPARVGAYQKVILTWASFAAILCAYWFMSGRAFSDLGFRSSSVTELMVGLLLGGAFSLFIWFQVRGVSQILKGGDERKSGLEGIIEFMPRSKREERWFHWVSLNAGISEEMIYRGFLIWYLLHLVGTVWAALIAVIAFTYAHAYQGVKQLPGIALAAIVMVALYLISGSLWLPILVHIVMDAIQGSYIAKVLRQEPALATDNCNQHIS